MSNPANVGELKERLLSAEQQIRVIGLGLGGLIALAFGNLTSLIADSAPRWLMGVLVTLVVLAAGLLARAWIAMRNAGAGIDGLADTVVITDNSAKKPFNTYKIGRTVFRVALGVIVAAGMCYLAATWIWVAEPSQSSSNSEHLSTQPCRMTKDCQEPTWSGRRNGTGTSTGRCAGCLAPNDRRRHCTHASKSRPDHSESLPERLSCQRLTIFKAEETGIC